jgi:putative heme transporter
MSGTVRPMSNESPEPVAAPHKTKPVVRVIQILVAIIVVVAVFFFLLPKIADYSAVWATIADLTWLEIGSLLAVSIVNIVSYWPQMMAAMPGLTLGQAAVNNQTTTTISNILPFGGAIAVGTSVAMYLSWGFTGPAIALVTLLTGIWNSFLKLGLPVVALAILAIMGDVGTGLVVAALIGLVILVAAIILFALMLWKKEFARTIGSWLGRALSAVRRLFRKPPVETWGDAAVRFRHQTIALLARRWIPLTIATVVSHIALYLVLLMALRHVGVSEQEVSAAEVLAVFSIGRLATAAPITPGGLGVVELAYIGGLVLAGRNETDVPLDLFRAQVAAAVLLFRLLTYGIQIPMGAVTYVIWLKKKSWRKPPPSLVPVGAGVGGDEPPE